MTKKDFEAIANVLNANMAPMPLVLDFADMLGEQNERFDRERFVRASTTLFLADKEWSVAFVKKQRGE